MSLYILLMIILLNYIYMIAHYLNEAKKLCNLASPIIIIGLKWLVYTGQPIKLNFRKWSDKKVVKAIPCELFAGSHS